MEPNIVYGSPLPTQLLENIDLSLSDYLLKFGNTVRDSICMVNGNTHETLTKGSVIDSSYKIAAKLQSLGCKQGCVVGVIVENGFQFPIIILGILRTGATLCCFNNAYSAGEFSHTFSVVKPDFLFVTNSGITKLRKVCSDCDSIKLIIEIGGKQSSSNLSYESILQDQNYLSFVPTKVESDSTAVLLFSSGSTGLPKGVMLSHRNIILLMELIRMKSKLFPVEHEQTSLSVIPMFHGYGFMLLLQSLCTNAKLVFLNKFEENSFLNAIQSYKVTSLNLVPSLMIFLAKHPAVGNYDLSSIRDITCGAAPLSSDIEEEVRKKFNLPNVVKGYGMTETTIVCTSTFFSGHKPGSVGKLRTGALAKIVDTNTGKNLGSNKEGEMCVKGMLLMKGYYNNEAETNAAIDKDGWLHTGDIAYYDDEEDFFIVDRIKDLIKYKGFQVAPAELEALLLKHDAVKDVAVVGVPDEISGEVPRAFVVKKSDVTEKELMGYVSENVGPHMKLRGGVVFLSTIPRNSNGKILKKDLRLLPRAKL